MQDARAGRVSDSAWAPRPKGPDDQTGGRGFNSKLNTLKVNQRNQPKKAIKFKIGTKGKLYKDKSKVKTNIGREEKQDLEH